MNVAICIYFIILRVDFFKLASMAISVSRLSTTCISIYCSKISLFMCTREVSMLAFVAYLYSLTWKYGIFIELIIANRVRNDAILFANRKNQANILVRSALKLVIFCKGFDLKRYLCAIWSGICVLFEAYLCAIWSETCYRKFPI